MLIGSFSPAHDTFTLLYTYSEHTPAKHIIANVMQTTASSLPWHRREFACRHSDLRMNVPAQVIAQKAILLLLEYDSAKVM